MTIDLKPFCGTEETRYYLMAPASRGEWTYATNGHIMVRVPRMADIREVENFPSAEKVIDPLFANFDGAPFPEIQFPEPERDECAHCKGSGKAHNCPDCECECVDCDGTGETVERIALRIRGVLYDSKYIKLIAALPGLTFTKTPPQEAPAPFRFNGGEGCLMPMRWEEGHTIEVEEPKP